MFDRPRRHGPMRPSGAKSQIARFRFEGHHHEHDVLIGNRQTIQIVPGASRMLRLGTGWAWGFAVWGIDFAHDPLRAHFENTANLILLTIPQLHVDGRWVRTLRPFRLNMAQ